MSRVNEIKVGLVVILALVTIVIGTFWLKGTRFGAEEILVQARFREAGQILEGNTVKLRGVPIGRVAEVALEPGGQAVIATLRIGEEVPLPEDPVVILSPESMFGDWQAEIFPRSTFPRYDYLEAPDPSVLPGYSLPDISRLTAVADEIAQNLRVLSDRVSEAFTEETAANIVDMIANIQQVSDQLTGLIASQQQSLDAVAADLQNTTQALGETAITIRRAFAQVDTAIGEGRLARIVNNVERTTAQSDSLTAALLVAARELQETANIADDAFRSVGAIASALQEGRGTLGRLLSDTTLYAQIVDTNDVLQALLIDFQRNPRKYINLTVF
jgi:phospholipid/cholesterol/gamma-HCH transport system substrate-binding protein